MYHVWRNEERQAPDPGDLCRPLKHCTPIDLYWTYLGPSTEEGTSVIETVGGRRFAYPTDLLTTTAPFSESCGDAAHLTTYKAMTEIYVRRSRGPSSAPPGRKRRETKTEHDARLARWEEALA